MAMANFFNFKTGSVKDAPSSKASCSYARIHNNINVTSNSNLPMIPQSNNDASVLSISKEIDFKLKVLNKFLPHEQIVKLSQDFIGKLDSACFEKVAESICADSGAPNVYGGASSICSSVGSYRLSTQTRAAPCGISSRLAPVSNKKNVTQLIFEAAKSLRLEKDDLETINEEPQGMGLTVNSSREKPGSKRRAKMPLKSIAVPTSQDLDDSSCFRKPTGTVRTQKPKTNRNNPDSSTAKKKKMDRDTEKSTTDLNLTITKESLRSNARTNKKYAVSSNMKRITSSKIRSNGIADSPSSLLDMEELEQNESDAMVQIMSRPKKTALSPFFNRFKKRCNSQKITSTPLRK